MNQATTTLTRPDVNVAELGHVNSDKDLRIVLVNLISNALKLNVDRPGTQVWVERTSMPTGGTVILVRDNGVGFDAKDAARAFEPFQRMKAASHVPGYGLGLAIVRRAVSRLGGTVSAESAPGQGTTIRIRQPH